MTNSADQLIYRAATLLDEQDDAEGAMALLREAIDLSETAGYQLQEIRARTFLGELLMDQGRNDEAAEEFESLLHVAEDYRGAIAEIEDEVASAKERLASLLEDASD